ncbi:MAG TPA: fasciclin domain-containing protein [Arenimonas sp.]|nr:fasciclin domain-containing protein [Arenimonas sp.]
MTSLKKALFALALGLTATTAFAGASKNKTPGTIVEVAASNPDFSTLVAAVKAAGLVDTLNSKGPFTVFAPTNAAFAKLPAGTVESLLKPENKEKLTAILTFHVVAGKVTAAEVVKLNTANTVNGKAVAIAVGESGVMVNDAKVTATDIMASNGVIHVIDTILIP